MAKRRWFLIAAFGLAVAWTGWLIYLVVMTATPIVISQPQLDTAEVLVEARLPAEVTDFTEVLVTHVHRGHMILRRWPGANAEKEQRIHVTNLKGIRGWRGAGDYILPLHAGDGAFMVAGIPPSPGFLPPANHDRVAPVIYPATPSTRRQLETILQSSAKP
jgi:hypothetical protein